MFKCIQLYFFIVSSTVFARIVKLLKFPEGNHRWKLASAELTVSQLSHSLTATFDVPPRLGVSRRGSILRKTYRQVGGIHTFASRFR